MVAWQDDRLPVEARGKFLEHGTGDTRCSFTPSGKPTGISIQA